ncbi:hypothetical protein BGZ83_001534 [Gryganskiella cystojenkinii]|nr:hypothetical protein BGZ83_001534 [Gryganskiella cystojenkinii]
MASSFLWMVAIGVALQTARSAAPSSSQPICTTQQCVLTSSDIIRDMNPQADPCQDFSEFVCGGFEARSEIAPDQSSNDNFLALHERNQRILHSIVDTNSSSAPKAPAGDLSAHRNIEKFQSLYSSCMDQDRLTQLGRKPLEDEIQQVLKLFPVTESDLKAQQDQNQLEVVGIAAVDKESLSKTLAYFNKMGIDTLVGLSVGQDLKVPSKNVLSVTEGGLGLPAKDYYLDKAIIEKYQDTVRRMLSLIFGPHRQGNAGAVAVPETDDRWTTIAKDVVDFETKLAGIGTGVDDLYDPVKTYNPSTVDKLGSMTPSINWPLLLNSALPTTIKPPAQVIVSWPAFQIKLEGLLKSTAPKTLQNYFSWSVIRSRAGDLGPEYQQPLRDLNAALTGESAAIVPERWKHCVSVVSRSVGELAGHYYIEEAFKGNSRDQASGIIQSLLLTYSKVFPKLEWLDKATTIGAVKKLKAIRSLVGYSTEEPNTESSDSLDGYYKDLRVDPMDFYGNRARASAWTTEQNFLDLNKPINKKSMGSPPQTVNAFYSPSVNQIYFPAGILQPPFFHTDNPEYINYGGIGVVAGHEITHGFDNKGHLFDSEGRMIDWWTNTTSRAFDEKARCFVEQYGNFTISGPDGKVYHVNGQLTLGENIADNGGLKQSFNSWQTRYKADKTGKKYMNMKLPGLENFSPEQLFFISYGRLWCSKQRPESLIQQVITDPHSPARWRINGAVQNSVQFSTVFKCKANTPMNPSKKCDLW